jgi:hypothetical protein
MYLDPGVTGMLVQIIIVIAAFGGAILFSMRKKIKAFFKKNKDGTQPQIDTISNDMANDDDAIDVLEDK